MESAVDRWQAIIDARAQQMDAAYARLGRTSADFWDRRARGFHRSTKDTIANDPLYRKLRAIVTPETSVLDVGAGTGRFTLALAPQAKHITAIEPNASTPTDLSADIVICSHVLYPLKDIVPFLSKLQAATRQACYIYMRATPIDALTAPFWQHFHGDERCLPPSYIHALDVLYEMDIYANVAMVHLPPSLRYPSVDVAVSEMMEQLILPGDEKTRDELRDLLTGWLVEQDDVLVPPAQNMVCAIMYWTSF
ncbi:MAG: methyltransferase domain-containing protein [Chloroflexi bacterium]|nr:MAG: methyltransferase domain-containing protein [Chloroflexota bacterium]